MSLRPLISKINLNQLNQNCNKSAASHSIDSTITGDRKITAQDQHTKEFSFWKSGEFFILDMFMNIDLEQFLMKFLEVTESSPNCYLFKAKIAVTY